MGLFVSSVVESFVSSSVGPFCEHFCVSSGGSFCEPSSYIFRVVGPFLSFFMNLIVAHFVGQIA